MAGFPRGEIYWADLTPVRGKEQAGLRPVSILSNDLFNRRSGTAVAMAITSQPQAAGFPLTLALSPDKLSKPSWVKISQIRTSFIERIGRRTAALKEEDPDQVIGGLLELIR